MSAAGQGAVGIVKNDRWVSKCVTISGRGITICRLIRLDNTITSRLTSPHSPWSPRARTYTTHEFNNISSLQPTIRLIITNYLAIDPYKNVADYDSK